jgi:hypothetical protein
MNYGLRLRYETDPKFKAEVDAANEFNAALADAHHPNHAEAVAKKAKMDNPKTEDAAPAGV